MRALDTNVLLRHLLQDDPVQSPVATRFLSDELSEQEPGFVSIAVLCELIWTLRSAHGADAARIADVVERLLEAKQIVVAGEEVVFAALALRHDLADALVHELGRAAGCSETVTFDRRFARLEGVRLLSA